MKKISKHHFFSSAVGFYFLSICRPTVLCLNGLLFPWKGSWGQNNLNSWARVLPGASSSFSLLSCRCLKVAMGITPCFHLKHVYFHLLFSFPRFLLQSHFVMGIVPFLSLEVPVKCFPSKGSRDPWNKDFFFFSRPVASHGSAASQ